MKPSVLVLAVFLITALAAPDRGYSAPGPGNLHQLGRADYGVGHSCGNGFVRQVDGSCVKPIVNRNVFVFAAPKLKYNHPPTPNLPEPRIEHNIVFIRAPEHPKGYEPIVMPPPQQKTQVYVLAKKPDIKGQQVYEAPGGPVHKPEVFFVQYKDGDNPQLPGGVDLKTALSGAAQNAQIFGGGGHNIGSLPGGLAGGFAGDAPYAGGDAGGVTSFGGDGGFGGGAGFIGAHPEPSSVYGRL